MYILKILPCINKACMYVCMYVCNRFTKLCLSVLFKFEISCHCESFFLKSNANLVMFTTMNVYETTLNSTYIHHILKIRLQYILLKKLYLHWNDCNDRVYALP